MRKSICLRLLTALFIPSLIACGGDTKKPEFSIAKLASQGGTMTGWEDRKEYISKFASDPKTIQLENSIKQVVKDSLKGEPVLSFNPEWTIMGLTKGDSEGSYWVGGDFYIRDKSGQYDRLRMQYHVVLDCGADGKATIKSARVSRQKVQDGHRLK